MKKFILGVLMVFGLIGASEAQYYAPWYAKNPNFTNVTLGGWLRIGGTLDVAGTSTFVSSVTCKSDVEIDQKLVTKWITTTSTLTVNATVGNLIGGVPIGSGNVSDIGVDSIAGRTANQLTMGNGVSLYNIFDKTAKGIAHVYDPLYVGVAATRSTWTASGLALRGDIQISSRPCAEFFFDLNASSLTSITTNMQYELVCGTSIIVAANSSWFYGATDANGNPNKFTYVGPNTHRFLVTAACSYDASAATVLYQGFRKNGVLIPCSRQHLAVSNSGSETEPVSSCIVSLATNDTIELVITTSDSDDASMHLGSITFVCAD